ncbi:MFS transporter [Streptomyces sp. NPDC050535]|uniref:MFS transporter n=1 Tax=Streptomyces sp. NPDC050535 TaxID=3365626 RepID=UPI0037952657
MTVSPVEAPLWRDRQFVLLACARVISVLGNGFARVALAFAVLALPGAGAGRLSLVLACQALPQLVFILAGGVIADRMSRSGLMVLADVMGAGAYTGLAVMVLTGHAPLVAMCLLAVAAGSATALFAPASDGLVPLIVPVDRLQRANGLLRVGTNSSMLLGLALSGVTVALVGAGWALVLNAASFVVSAVLTARLRVAARPRRKASGWAELREGWQEFASRQWLWVVVAQYSVVIAAVNANVGVLGPLTAEQHLGGARAWSVIMAAQAVGTIAGAGLASRVRVKHPVRVAVLCTFPAAVPIALLGAEAPVWLIAAAMFGAGVAGDVFGVLWATTIQQEIPERLLSRVSSYDWFGSLALAPLGLLLAGPIAATLGTRRTLAGCASLLTLATMAALLSPQVRSLRATA